MFKNHLISILRNLKRSKGYTVINISGLAIGFATAILIGIYVSQEFSYDKHIKDYERVYRLSNRNFAFASITHMNMLQENVAGVEATVNIMPHTSGTIKYGQSGSIIEPSVFYSTQEYLKVFDIPFVYGNPETAFDKPSSILITKSMSKKMFGDKNPLGESVSLSTLVSNDVYEVSGVVQDLPSNTHLRFEVLARYPVSYEKMLKEQGFNSTVGYTYFKLEKPMDNIQNLSDRVFAKPQYDMTDKSQDFETYLASYKLRLPMIMNIADVHLKSNIQFEASPPGNRQYLIVFIGIAVFIIILAGINYVNLSTAQASKRAKEVGVRKVLGSQKKDLITRFILESFLLTFGAALLAMGLAEVALKVMGGFGFENFNVNVLDYPFLLSLVMLTAIMTGVLSGVYPAFILTSFKASVVLKGNHKVGSSSKTFRNGLVVFQFVVSLSLATFSIFVYQQLNYGLTKDLGFDKEGVIVLDNSKGQLGENVDPFKNELLQLPEITNVSSSAFSMIGNLVLTGLTEVGGNGDYHRAQYKYADSDFVPTMGLNVIDGRNFNDAIDGYEAILINESFAEVLGDGFYEKRFTTGNGDEKYKIVGVVEDFHYADFSVPIAPTLFFKGDEHRQFNIKIRLDEIDETISKIDALYAGFSDEPLDYYFFDQKFHQLFQAEKRMSRIISIFTGLSLFVAFLGLIGLISYKLDQRTKEIGIRKVLGASIGQILSMLSKEMVWLIGLSFLISIPLAYYGVQTWMNDFAYHVSLSAKPFITIGLLTILLVILVVFARSMKTATSNPTQVLRNE
ncbi:ABC transporter permease [Roseivirga misakiensis]|uniref:ABC transporter permease n=1 Tax=Roseivirga misakiensis TaxID=1563681 RepID=A0A1E5SYI8_9BACT|nr:ABC transporter permease [Roseivirga misakiensis]OEK04181.1 hypothetical protein BFP71_11905 [Roseivirga misakiensis]